MSDLMEFYSSVLDSLPEHIAVFDENGGIEYVNAAWTEFAIRNAGTTASEWKGINYLRVCETASLEAVPYASEAMTGLREVISGRRDLFCHEYPCHSPDEQRWFMMTANRLRWSGDPRYIVVHHNITRRRLLEDELRKLSLSDELTGLENRRHFDIALREEWLRCRRSGDHLALVIFDVDHFKAFNDRYGHPAGDECLIALANVLRQFGRRPEDLVARYGGEEFALILRGASGADAARIARRVLESVAALRILHADSPTAGFVTMSAGAASLVPGSGNDEMQLLRVADAALYTAKESGRNQVKLA